METINETKNWLFLAVEKSRIIKELDKAYLIKIGDENETQMATSTILPKVFKRKKETETHIFFSLPYDFKINVRFTHYVEEENQYETTDQLFELKYCYDDLYKTLGKKSE